MFVPRRLPFLFCALILSLALTMVGSAQTPLSPMVTDLFNRPGGSSPRDLYKLAHEQFTAGNLDNARLLAMRILLDGHRSQNLLDLLGTIEVKAGRPLLAGEWLRKAVSMNLDDNVARKVLLRLPPPPRPIPMDQGSLEAHFAQISQKLPALLQRLNTPRLHFDSVLDEITRGQFYKALALAEEYEKKYPGADGTGLTALCALYLGRTRDALQLVEQGLKKDPYHSLLLFVKIIATDTNPETSSPNRAQALFDQDRWAEALQAADQLTALFPRSGEGLLVKARIAYERRQYGPARSLLDQAAIRDPDHPGIDLLRSDIALAQNQREQAAQHIERAFRRGYHLPSVNLKAALLALIGDQAEEAAKVLDETEALQPFLDREAYPLFIELALYLDRLPQARKALDAWQKRQPLNSAVCFLEAFYNAKSGDAPGAIGWSRRGVEMNPERTAQLRPLAIYTELQNDPVVGPRINLLRQTPKSSAPVPLPPPAAGPIPRAHGTTTAAAANPTPTAKPAPTEAPTSTQPVPDAPLVVAGAETGERYSIEVAGQPPHVVEGLKQGIDAAIDRVETLFGVKPRTVKILLTTSAVTQTNAAEYAFDTGKISLAVHCLNYPAIKTALDTERPELDENQKTELSQNLGGHTLAGEVTQALLFQLVKNLELKMLDSGWIRLGLAEVAGGNEIVLKDRLTYTQARIAGGELKLQPIDQVNQGLNRGSGDFTVYQASRIQAYLMVSFLLKKANTVNEGFTKLVGVLKDLVGGKTLAQSLPARFKISISEFESGWKEAAFWALKNGQPYEW